MDDEKSGNKGGESGESDNSRVSVYVRVRPLTPEEKKDEAIEHVEGLALDDSIMDSCADTTTGGAAALESSATGVCIGGFDGVFGQGANNRRVFDVAFEKRLPAVLRGATCSLFCYGYTGGGKTYTAIGGYEGQEKGLFFLAAERLLR